MCKSLLKPSLGEAGVLTVCPHARSYVDAQLKMSRRFDAAGLAREHPEFFAPFSKRRTSSSSSVHSGSGMTNGHSGSDNHSQPEGQLRYWTAEMCNKSPHLFDFVVTVSFITSVGLAI